MTPHVRSNEHADTIFRVEDSYFFPLATLPYLALKRAVLSHFSALALKAAVLLLSIAALKQPFSSHFLASVPFQNFFFWSVVALLNCCVLTSDFRGEKGYSVTLRDP